MPVENRGTKKNPRWRYAFTIRGVRYRAAVPEARTKFEALKAEIDAKKEIFEGRYGRPTGERDLVDFIEQVYLPWARAHKRSWKNDLYNAPVICEWFKGKTFAQISPLLIEKFKQQLRESITKKGTPRSARSVNEFLEMVSRIFTLAIRENETDTNPCKEVQKLPLHNKRVRYLEDEEEPRLLAVLIEPRAHLRPMVIVAIGTGMRRGDQLNLRWEKVDFQRNLIYVPNSKTGNDYGLPMSEQVRNELLELRRRAGESEYVFVNPATGRAFTEIKKAFATACRLAKIKNLHWHDLRHTFGTRLAEAGYSEAVIAELMGHSDPNTTRRYTHGTERGKRAAVEAATTRGAERKELWLKIAKA